MMVAAFFFPTSMRRKVLILLINCTFLAVMVLIRFGEDWTSYRFISVVRDWLPAMLILVVYHEAGMLISNRRNTAFEQKLLSWDRRWLEGTFQRLRPSRFGLIKEFLEFCYLLCYPLVPLGLGSLYLARLNHLADAFWVCVLPPILFCYASSPFFPSLPPRRLSPAPPAERLLLRRINVWVLNRGSIHANTFPSAHVAGSLATAFALIQFLPFVGTLYLVVAAGITLGSVYGRYHYGADGVLGIVVALAGLALSQFFFA